MTDTTTIPQTLTTTSADGTTIAYERTGSGPAIVLVDGAMCTRDFGPMRPVAAALSDAFTVYAYDRRGRGESGDTAPYAVQREIEDLLAMIAVTGGPSLVFGSSSGAALALEAAMAGAPISRLAVWEPPYVATGKAEAEPDHVANSTALVEAGRPGDAVTYFLTKMVGAPAFVGLIMKLNRRIWRKMQAVGHTIPYDARIMDGFVAPAERLAAIGQPTLVALGGRAKPNMRAAVLAVADAVPNAEFRELPGQMHNVATTAISPLLREWFLRG
ncbi:alpha/beta fold hydrolase [Naasia lichenicola]|uniref:Alpha/beta fold hydrolase n=1 Tax=Naasia lichenicola TaxID=2565933 RepID=A0A4S4FRX6_9MICO|nr:alpha/beta hydrolase [Naasia lichenicola]THG33423.1 alpha/beta fold hydrolase [Naasia lichenicola]